MNWAPIIGIALWALIPGLIAKKKGRSFWGYYFLSFVITPLITIIITICLSNLKSVEASAQSIITSTNAVSIKEEIVAKNAVGSSENGALLDNSSENTSPTKISRIRFCRRCGFELIDGSNYCSRCGTEI